MDDMTDTQEQPSGPRVDGEQMRDVSRLRRSRTDRYVAGVAGGLGRHFDIDPTVIRVVLAVLTLFGGAGLLVYVAVWVLVPEEGEQRAPIGVGSELQKVLLIAAAVVAACIVFGTPFAHSGWAWGFPLPLLLIGLVALWIYSLARRDRHPAPPAPWGGVTQSPMQSPAQSFTQTATQTATQSSTPAAPPEGTTMSSTQAPGDTHGDTLGHTLGDTAPVTGTPYDLSEPPAQQPPAWMPPPTPAYAPPPRPRRTGLVLFWPTLALIAIALGTLGMFDVNHSVVPSAYVALALAIIAVMLSIGAFVGRPGGLIALGLLASLGLGASTAIEASTDWQTGGETVSYTPTSSAAVSGIYSVPNGRIDLDLRGVKDLAALDGRTIDLHLNAGEIDVELPPGVNAIVDAKLSFAGDVEINGDESNGLNPQLSHTISSSINPATAPTLTLEINGRVGHISVGRD
jgi:phage shock protein PspC (stress-responsive transcriptional regulator)